MSVPNYDLLAAEYKRSLTSNTPLPREQYTVRIRAEGESGAERDFELIGIYAHGLGARVVALDPELDPRKAVRVDGLRGVSLSNYLNHVVGMARPGLATGPGSYRWIPVRSCGALPHGADTRIDFERQSIVLAHDFRHANPERNVAQAQAAVVEFALLWLETGWVLSARVFNFEPGFTRDRETHFLSLQSPKAYGEAGRLPWGRGLPFVAVNRKFLVGFKCAQAREELEQFLLAVPHCRPKGFTPNELALE